MNGRKRQDWVWLTLNQSSSRGRESLDQSVGKRGFAPFYLSAHRSCLSPPLPAFPFIPRPAEFGRKNEATPSGLSASIDFHPCSSQLVAMGSSASRVPNKFSNFSWTFSFERKMILWNFDWNCLSKFVKINRIKYSIYRWWRYTYIF